MTNKSTQQAPKSELPHAHKITYQHEPERYFLLEIVSFPKIPSHLIPFLGTIKKGTEWESLGFNPYNVITTGETWESVGFGSFIIDGFHYTFSPFIAYCAENKKWGQAIQSRKRYVKDAHEVYQLKLLGVPYEEISNLSPHFRAYAEGQLAMDSDNFQAAIYYAEAALKLHPNELRYKYLLFAARAKSGDLSVIDEGLDHYKNDMDSAIHSGKVETWIKLAIEAKNYALALNVVMKAIDGIDALLADRIYPKSMIYGAQRKEFYKYKRKQLIKRLGTLRGFLCAELISQNIERPNLLSAVLDQIVRENPVKAKKVSKLLSVSV